MQDLAGSLERARAKVKPPAKDKKAGDSSDNDDDATAQELGLNAEVLLYYCTSLYACWMFHIFEMCVVLSCRSVGVGQAHLLNKVCAHGCGRSPIVFPVCVAKVGSRLIKLIVLGRCRQREYSTPRSCCPSLRVGSMMPQRQEKETMYM